MGACRVSTAAVAYLLAWPSYNKQAGQQRGLEVGVAVPSLLLPTAEALWNVMKPSSHAFMPGCTRDHAYAVISRPATTVTIGIFCDLPCSFCVSVALCGVWWLAFSAAG